MEKSIYQQICDHITDGILDESFSLQDEDPDGAPFKWAPGAMDGVAMYHMQHSGLDASQAKGMAKALKSAASGNYPEAEGLFNVWTKENRAISVIDELQKYVIDHSARLDAGNVFQTALSMMLHSTHIECVKIGMELMELFLVNDEKVREVIRRLGLYDEFTIFAVWNMQKWEDGNSEIFKLAKKVHSWGRIHAVERLEPETDEIRHWLLTEGTVNGVVNAYSSLTCWQKANAEEILFGQPTEEEFKGITTLIDGLLDEGPVPGISELEDAENMLLRFLEIAPHYNLTDQDYDVILSVQHWADDEDVQLPSVSAACDKILRSSSCTDTIRDAVKECKALRLAEELDIPFRDDLLKCLEKDFDHNYSNCGYLMDSPDYVEPTLQLFRKNLPLSDMEGEPEDNLGLGEEYRSYNQLQFILQELGSYPFMGIEFMIAGLRSPVISNRNRVLANLKIWVQKRQMPLSELSPELYTLVRQLREKEVNGGAMEMIVPLLEGQTIFINNDEESEDE